MRPKKKKFFYLIKYLHNLCKKSCWKHFFNHVNINRLCTCFCYGKPLIAVQALFLFYVFIFCLSTMWVFQPRCFCLEIHAIFFRDSHKTSQQTIILTEKWLHIGWNYLKMQYFVIVCSDCMHQKTVAVHRAGAQVLWWVLLLFSVFVEQNKSKGPSRATSNI